MKAREKMTKAELLGRVRQLEARLDIVERRDANREGELDRTHGELRRLKLGQPESRLKARDLKFLADSTRSIAYLRLEAGHHPESVLSCLWSMWVDFMNVYCNGAFDPSRAGSRTNRAQTPIHC